MLPLLPSSFAATAGAMLRRLSQPGRFGPHWLPSQCALCHAWPAQRLCHTCRSALVQPHTPRCARCALRLPTVNPLHPHGHPMPASLCPACQRQPPMLDACWAAVSYGFPWDGVISQFKFQHDTGWAHPLAQLLLHTPGVTQALHQADALLPLPLAPPRLRERGYNQALLLARALLQQAQHASLAPLPRLHAHSLRRHPSPRAQSGLRRSQRLRNLQALFYLPPDAARQLAGQRVLLLDDVLTTGATLHAAAQTLRQAGVAHLGALVLARTEENTTPD